MAKPLLFMEPPPEGRHLYRAIGVKVYFSLPWMEGQWRDKSDEGQPGRF